jgi:hypothetical protein
LKQRFIFARPKKKENTGQPALRGWAEASFLSVPSWSLKEARPGQGHWGLLLGHCYAFLQAIIVQLQKYCFLRAIVFSSLSSSLLASQLFFLHSSFRPSLTGLQLLSATRVLRVSQLHSNSQPAERSPLLCSWAASAFSFQPLVHCFQLSSLLFELLLCSISSQAVSALCWGQAPASFAIAPAEALFSAELSVASCCAE